MVKLFRGVHYISSYISNMTLFNYPFHYFVQVRDVRSFVRSFLRSLLRSRCLALSRSNLSLVLCDED